MKKISNIVERLERESDTERGSKPSVTKKPGYKPRPSRTAFYWVLENEQLNF
ncbi:hypothetical protein CKA32_005154 [Geitlerinema sp. FC II]|nr:hypothetical protein CKA32_005154 [Geitlerinema sp. FC II]